MEDLKYWLWLNSINDVGPVRARALLDVFKSPQRVWAASKNKLLKAEGIGELTADIITSGKNEEQLNFFEKEITKIQKSNIDIITLYDKEYPANLRNIYSAPTIFYKRGNLISADSLSIAIVGSRNATTYGLKIAYDLAKALANRGITIVSGLARGIDTQAHKGALDGGGRTIAVLGCGLDVIYPPENKKLYNDITDRGAVISEFPLGTIPDARNFPQRNRIISGIAKGTVIVEANKKSGSLITADFALEQNREVFAVPGSIYSRFSEGTNNLIKDGAKVVTCVEDILEELKITYIDGNEKFDESIAEKLSGEENQVYQIMSYEPLHLENLALKTGFPISRVNTIITMLELKGIIKQLPGKQFVKS